MLDGLFHLLVALLQFFLSLFLVLQHELIELLKVHLLLFGSDQGLQIRLVVFHFEVRLLLEFGRNIDELGVQFLHHLVAV